MSRETDASANPKVAVPAAPVPVVSFESLVNETVGAAPAVYVPATSIVTALTPLPKSATTAALRPLPVSVIVMPGPALYPLPLLVTAIAVIDPAETEIVPKTACSHMKN